MVQRTPRMDFHVSWAARDRYEFDDWLFAITGNVLFANFHGARIFAQRMNQKRDLLNAPEQAVRASQINALGLIHELTHFIFQEYCEQYPNLLPDLERSLNQSLGEANVEATLRSFVADFPPPTVYREEVTADAYLAGETDGRPNTQIVLEEALMLWVGNANPAFAPFLELFDDTNLAKTSPYTQAIDGMRSFFGDVVTQPEASGVAATGGTVGGTVAGAAVVGGAAGQTSVSQLLKGQNLINVLLAPARAVPHSLEGQLDFMRQRWGVTLGRQVYRLLSSMDLIKEEEKPVFFGGPGGPGGPSIEIPVYTGESSYPETENFTPDREWMPRLVMIAKNAYVWLDQLSKQYGRPIRTLADIPDEELDMLGNAGFTGLWLIGLWERSTASQRIKQIMGNEDAVASAYSLFDYQIAHALGGEAACQSLRERAWERGIRLASDMVPNHVGVDGRWVTEHPDWFVSLEYSPFPSYTFSGPDLSPDERVGIYLEDHYYSKSDAAVVFKRVDHGSGAEQYVYHGNDGTSMAWNDTAQLNYINPDVREAVIQTILHVARQFPIIRFDAAMTLAKKHFQRLWFPEPGTGGDIASRADHGMTRAEFDKLMPQEFWREVVDRAAVEAPDTLLLAEAFWLMESYFVRTLGMHRVYNSAFMHILRDEENAKYRMLMKNTLEFDPEILKRYVNFMNNPDERTAVDQFGKGDKYFGVCTLLVTMPGLPMFGHGQIEGYAEKYGMEYQRAYWDERPDGYLFERHEREIFPLIHKRYLFADVTNFLLYDFYAPDSSVNENVFAYSNRVGDERALVVYHNTYANAQGWVRTSAAYMARTGNGDERQLLTKTLGEGLDLDNGDDMFCVFRDQASDLEYIRSSRELIEQGLYVELGAYRCQVFLDFRQVQDNEWQEYAQLAAYLNGRGVPSVADALKEIFLQPVHRPVRELVNADMFRRLMAARATANQLDDVPTQPLDDETLVLDALDDDEVIVEADLVDAATLDADAEASELVADAAIDLIDEVEQRTVAMLRELKAFGNGTGDEEAIASETRRELEAILNLPLLEQPAGDETSAYSAAVAALRAGITDDEALWGTLYGWTFVHNIGKLFTSTDSAEQSRSLIDEWLLGRVLAQALQEFGLSAQRAEERVTVIKQLTSSQHWFQDIDRSQASELLQKLLQDREVQGLLGVNRYQGTLWFSKGAFEHLVWWMLLLAVVETTADKDIAPAKAIDTISRSYVIVDNLQEAANGAGYQVEMLLKRISVEDGSDTSSKAL